MTDERKEANAKISKKLAEATALIRECEAIADEFGVEFHWDGPEYGMGGYYTPDFEHSDEESWYNSDETGWQASSHSC